MFTRLLLRVQPSVTVRVQPPGQCASLRAASGPRFGAPDSFGHAQHLLIKEVGSLMSLTPRALLISA